MTFSWLWLRAGGTLVCAGCVKVLQFSSKGWHLPIAALLRAMQIFIKTLTGRKTNFNFELDNTVRHVKEALQEKEGIQVEQIRLIYSGKQMSDECTLNDYNVKPGSTDGHSADLLV
eukprot:s5601_g2.t1